MKLFGLYLKQRWGVFCAFILFFITFFITFYLYHLPVKAVIYPFMLCTIVGMVMIIVDFIRVSKKHISLSKLKGVSAPLISELPKSPLIECRDYQDIIRSLKEQQRDLQTEMTKGYNETVEYYTVWAHQIKTPIAAMKLNLQNEDTPLSRRLSSDLFRIEQYVEMALTFLRLSSPSTDYVLKEYDLDSVIKQAVRKFSGEFINRKISLDYKPISTSVITDEKWLSFCLGQIISNALKYTREGSVKIYLETPKTLCIEDTGIGIAPEDLPRVFEKGYTGYNGRTDKSASGIGLYLCRSILERLGHKITASSVVGQGTVISINLEQYNIKE